MGDDWYERQQVGKDLTCLSEPHVHRYFAANFFHLRGRDADLVIDFGMGLRPLRPCLDLEVNKPVIAVATHIHADHVGGFHEFETRLGHAAEEAAFARMADQDTLADVFRGLSGAVSQAPCLSWSPEHHHIRPAPLTQTVDEGDVIDLGDKRLRVLHLPGHSHGSIGLLDEEAGLLFSGDVIYVGGLVDDLPCSDRALYRHTMQRLIDMEVNCVYGGHGPAMSATQMKEIARQYLQGTSAKATI
ncbi:MBL fold metallo-hydrolase [Pseudomonas sp. TH41]|uniref:MBL fold metallo-hydrolase n=1 Tax=Pseudomonas sp. TH41 TaxID=2796405 RepID=UPI0019119590|nr:MBL fold metallo-hydrolase [Pseudomonas sp. TH41]MBK5354501.1 MBL fold metallo-hydrolase [Pseudomonas sp. TH41]